jgi:hypothetical protein
MVRAKTIVPLLVAAGVFVCTIQMAYWPLLAKPGTTYEWWRVKWMADAGAYVGMPVLYVRIAIIMLPSIGINGAADVLIWICTVLWAAVVWMVVRLFFRAFDARPGAR